jgi:hypothetical protein
MKDRDQIILEQAYTNKINKTRKVILEELGDNEYEAEVDLDIFHTNNPNDFSLDDQGLKVKVRYTLELDFRNYGIKDISVYNVKIEPFSVDWEWDEDYGNEKPAPIQINIQDASNLEIDKGSVNGITLPFYPITLELWLDEKNQPIIEKSSLVFNQSRGY